MTVEVICDDDLTKVLESNVIQSKFAQYMPNQGADPEKKAMMALMKKGGAKKSGAGRKAVTKSTSKAKETQVPDAI